MVAAILVVGLLLSLPVAAVRTPSLSGTQLESAWQRYLQTQADNEPGLHYPYERCFRLSAQEFDLPLTLLLAVARGESDFNPRARSKSNAYGLMQILWPQTAKHLGIQRLNTLYDPCTNVHAGAMYLRELLDRYHGNLHLSLAAYNYGPGRIRVGSLSADIPSGANWYSGYIYRHLQYVLRRSKQIQKIKDIRYDAEGKLEVLVFHRPYRAEAFVNYLESRAPTLEVDWFRMGLGRFRVVALYKNKAELKNIKRTLGNLGLQVE